MLRLTSQEEETLNAMSSRLVSIILRKLRLRGTVCSVSLSYLHDLDVDSLMLLGRFGQPRLETVNSPLQVVTLATERPLNIFVYAAFLHLGNSTPTVHMLPAFLTLYVNCMLCE